MQEKIESMFANQNKAEQDGIEAADYSLVNIIRFGLLALDQMTENSHQSIILITDGNISFPNSISMEMALGIFRSSMITFSFVQIGSPPHPDSSFGYVPYNDFMKFLSKTTFGSYLMISPGYKSVSWFCLDFSKIIIFCFPQELCRSKAEPLSSSFPCVELSLRQIKFHQGTAQKWLGCRFLVDLVSNFDLLSFFVLIVEFIVPQKCLFLLW